jgi:putative transferase (TIGR04331 family)
MNGSKLFIFQHGSAGLHDYCNSYYEKNVCDKYFSWGNKSKDKITYPMFVSTTAGKKIKKKNPRGILIPIGEFSTFPSRNTLFPRDFSTTKIYRDNLIVFFSKVNKKILKLSTVKSHTTDLDLFTTNDIRSKFPNLKVNDFRKLKTRVFEDSVNFKLVVETMNSTGFLELLNLNIPVILFAPKIFFSAKKEYLKFYKLLENVGIIFFNATKAANFINKNYDNLDKWWNSKKLQNNRKIFCENMCRSRKNSSLFLAQSLKKLSN